MRFLFLVGFCLVLVFASSSKTVRVFSNGESSGSVEIVVPADVANLTSFIGTRKLANLLHTEGVTPDRVYNGRGLIVERYEDLVDGERLYVAAPGIRFVWPFVEDGHTVVLEPSWFETTPESPVTLTSLYERPRVFRLEGFFTEADCDALIQHVEGIEIPTQKLQRSGVGPEMVSDEKKKVVSSVRTSSNAFDSDSPTAVKLNHRAFELVRIPFDDLLVDGLQILRYNQKEAYIPHTDWFPAGSGEKPHNFEPSRGGSNRFATVFLYLSDVEKGGQTVFPFGHPLPGVNTTVPEELDTLFTPDQWEYKMVRQCYGNLSFAPKKGTAIIFYSQGGDGEMIEESLHGGCPVISGTKWAANLWVWNDVRYGLKPTGPNDTPAGLKNIVLHNTLDHPVHIFFGETDLTTIAGGEGMPFRSYVGHTLLARHPDDLSTNIWMAEIKEDQKDYEIAISPVEPVKLEL